MNCGRRVGLALAAAVMALPAPSGAWAEDRQKTVIKTVDQLRFKVPDDWPIERQGGAAGPVSVEEYLAMKFSNLDAHFQAVEQRLNQLELRLRVLEEGERQSELRAGEQATP